MFDQQRQTGKLTILLLALAACLFAQPNANGQVVVALGEPTEVKDVLTFNIKLHPAPEPVPAFKYRLTVLPHDTIPANAATLYLRSFGESSLSGPLRAAEKKFGFEEFHSWHDDETPIDSLPLEDVRAAMAYFDHYIDNHIARATRCRDCDWDYGEEDLESTEVFSFLLPSMQQTRSISRVLSVRTRFAIAEKRFDDAVASMRMNYQLGQNVSKLKILVCDLIGLAEIGITNKNMLDFIAAPDSPNMYWALTELRRPIISTRDSIRLESQSGSRIITQLKDAQTASHSEEEWGHMAREATKSCFLAHRLAYGHYGEASDEEDIETKADLAATGFGLLGYTAAKKRLIAAGTDAQAVEKMAVGQVLLIDASREYQKLANEMEKTSYLPFPEARKLRDKNRKLFRSFQPSSPGSVIAEMLLPAIEQVHTAQHRVQRDIDSMRVIEAIRMHAAKTGELPASLDDISVVPVPQNPMTGKSFVYQFENGAATLILPKSDGAGLEKRFVLEL